MKPWFVLGAIGLALGVVAGAFGAHGLKARLDADALALWETAVRYWFVASVGACLLGLAFDRLAPGPAQAAGFCLEIGALIFSGTVAVLALGGPRWLGAVTPIGGTLMIVAFGLMAWAAARGR